MLHSWCFVVILSAAGSAEVPSNLNDVLESFTKKGFRVLAVGTKILEASLAQGPDQAARQLLENHLQFIGLIAFENKLKIQSMPTVEKLKNANYKIIMITGDNQQTAESVARECKIIDGDQTLFELVEENNQVKCITSGESKTKLTNTIVDVENGVMGKDYAFSITGNAWRILREEYTNVLPQVLVKAAVFARMSSDQKKEVLSELSSLGYGTLMCGDGANDCGAIRAADVGISLSQQEASAAAAFTSHVEDVSSVTEIIRYGRCSLATSVSFFKYMLSGSIVMAVVERFMQGSGSDLSSGELTYLTLISYTNFALWFPRPDAYPGPLAKYNPVNNALSLAVVFPMLANIAVFFVFQVISFFLIKKFSWYTPPKDGTSYESYAMLCTVAFQIIILAVSQSPGYPFRLPIHRNRLLSLALIVMLILGILITLHPPRFFTDFLGIPSPPSLDFPFSLLALMVVNFLAVMLIERIITDKYLYERCVNYPYLIKSRTHRKYLAIQQRIQYNCNWTYRTFECTYKQSTNPSS